MNNLNLIFNPKSSSSEHLLLSTSLSSLSNISLRPQYLEKKGAFLKITCRSEWRVRCGKCENVHKSIHFFVSGFFGVCCAGSHGLCWVHLGEYNGLKYDKYVKSENWKLRTLSSSSNIFFPLTLNEIFTNLSGRSAPSPF